jgi:high-affinity iron transporter
MGRMMTVSTRRVRMAAVTTVVVGLSACLGRSQPSPEEGRALYLANGCATCHGADGHGEGQIASSLDPRPRDFRDSSAFKNGTSAVAISRTIAEGIGGGGAMPLFDHLTERERGSLALYITSLREHAHQGKSHP